MKKNLLLEPSAVLADGSYLSRLYSSSYARQRQGWGVLVRVIEYTLDDPGRPSLETYRLITTVLDPAKAPVHELATLYCERQEFEIAEDAFKTHLSSAGRVFRSHHPDGVHQDICGYFLAHYAIRVLRHEAAMQKQLAPERLSFTHALNVLQRKIIARRVFFLSGLQTLCQQALPDMLDPRHILPPATPRSGGSIRARVRRSHGPRRLRGMAWITLRSSPPAQMYSASNRKRMPTDWIAPSP